MQDKCHEEEPPLTDAGGGHQYRCWFPVGTPEGAAALEKNRKAGAAAASALTVEAEA